MDNFALEISDLNKVYSGGTQALKGISLNVKEGDFYALLGPNGAGSTERLKTISDIL